MNKLRGYFPGFLLLLYIFSCHSQPLTASVTVGNGFFNPTNVQIRTGGTVTFTWASANQEYRPGICPNQITNNQDPLWFQPSGQQRKNTVITTAPFANAGVYSYFGITNPPCSMTGTITVVAPTTTPSATTTAPATTTATGTTTSTVTTAPVTTVVTTAPATTTSTTPPTTTATTTAPATTTADPLATTTAPATTTTDTPTGTDTSTITDTATNTDTATTTDTATNTDTSVTTTDPLATTADPSATPTQSSTPTATGSSSSPVSTTTSPAPTGTDAASRCPKCIMSNRYVTVRWYYDSTRVYFELQARTLTGWFAIGIHENATMVGADIFWAQWDSGSVALVDRKAFDHSMPPANERQDLNLLSARQDSTYTYVSFWRSTDTGDVAGDIAMTKPLRLLWAFSNTPATKLKRQSNATWSFTQHTNAGVSGNLVNFVSLTTPFLPAPVVVNESLRRLHGVLMAVAWCMCLICSFFIARYGKNIIGPKWVIVHAVLNVLSLILTIVGVILMVKYTSQAGKKQFHYQGGHRIIGLVLLVVQILQGILGTVGSIRSTRVFSEKNKIPFYRIHHVIGFVLVLGGLFNCFLGMTMLCVSVLGLLGLGLLMGVGVLTFVTLDYLAWSREWGGWLMYGQDEGYAAPSGGGPPTLWLRIGFAVSMVLVIAASILLCVSILSNKPGTTKPYYQNCVVGKLHPTTSWGIYVGTGLTIFVFVAVFVIVMYRLNVHAEREDDEYVLMVDQF